MPDDDPKTIPNETRLFRRINPVYTVYDSNRKERRPTSQNFQDSRDGSPMSVFAENIAIAHGEVPAGFLRSRWAEWFLAAVPAGWMRENGQKVYPDPYNQDPDDSFASHAAVEGPKRDKARARLGDKYEWVVPPPNRFDP
jgi:hypothetical protein